MEQTIQIVHRDSVQGGVPPWFGVETARNVRQFHRGFPEYAPTPLARLKNLADGLGLAELFVKDESKRFGLNAFKVLGGSWAMGRCLAQKLGIPPGTQTYEQLVNPSTRAKLDGLTFVTATDGNHGRGVAWTAARFGAASVVYMPKGTASERLENIRALGARAEITPWNYDDTVRYASRQAAEHGWVLVQDTAWEGYEEIPAWIMEGYTTLALEIVEQLDGLRPTHIFLQAGVGALAGAAAGFFTDYYKEPLPVLTVVEPHNANCIFRTAQAGDGALRRVTGDLETIMAGLACGEPCSIAWNVLDACVQNFLSVPDCVAAQGMRILGNPLRDDPRIVSGESGAVTTGLVAEVMRRESLAALREQLGLGRDSVVLCISTEGDTDRANYRDVVWNGKYSTE